MFGISRQSIYQQEKRQRTRSEELLIVKQLVEQLRIRMPRLGTRKLYYLLKDDFVRHGVKIGRDGLFDYLRQQRLLVHPRKSYIRTTHSKHWLRKHQNLYKNLDVNEPERCFVSDITFIKSHQGVHYLWLVTDAYSRKIMGYHLSNDMGTENVLKALKMADKEKITLLKTIHHSDRGLQYCSKDYQDYLSKNNMIPSMTDGYDCYQNALAERINGILKNEFLIYKCNTREELEKFIEESIQAYNHLRPHLSLNMKTPHYIHEKTSELLLTGLN